MLGPQVAAARALQPKWKSIWKRSSTYALPTCRCLLPKHAGHGVCGGSHLLQSAWRASQHISGFCSLLDVFLLPRLNLRGTTFEHSSTSCLRKVPASAFGTLPVAAAPQQIGETSNGTDNLLVFNIASLTRCSLGVAGATHVEKEQQTLAGSS